MHVTLAAEFERATPAADAAAHSPDVREAEAVVRRALAPWLSEGRRSDSLPRLAEAAWQRIAESLAPGHGWTSLTVKLGSSAGRLSCLLNCLLNCLICSLLQMSSSERG